MADITNYTDFQNLIKSIPGKPQVLEALWDGDLSGWKLYLSVYTKKLLNRQLSEFYVGCISLGNDHRLFTGKVPPWPEAELAKEIGEEAKKKYGLEFYFPSPNHPDDDCPSYFQKHKAINCADCGKFIISTTSEYRPKDCCYKCHLTREQNQKIITEKEYNDGAYFYKVKDGIYSELQYASSYKSFDIYNYTKNQFAEQIIPNQISVVKITSSEKLIYLRNSLHQQACEAILKYEEPDRQKMSKFSTIYPITFEGINYDLQPYLNEVHQKIYKLFRILGLLDIVIEDKFDLEFYIKDNFTYRDDAFLRSLKYKDEEKTTVDRLKVHFEKLLSEEEINKTILKLIKMGCINRKDNIIEISDLGKKII